MLNCRKCVLALSRHNVVPGKGNIMSTILFLGDSPKTHENKSGAALSGLMYTPLLDELHRHNINDTKYYYTNIVKCKITNFDYGSFNMYANTCPYLTKEVYNSNFKIIVPLGINAINHTFGEEIYDKRMIGKVYDKGGIYIIPSYHPKYAFVSKISMAPVIDAVVECLKLL